MAEAARPLTVEPGGTLAGAFDLPGDKSITHRAYLLAGIAAGESRIEHPNGGADCASTLAALRALGVALTVESEAVRVRGCAMRFSRPAHPLDCGNSGTTLRLLAGLLASQPFATELGGDASLSRRPVARIVEPLRRMGARVRARDADRLPPLHIEGGPLEAIAYDAPVASAQVASCVLLAGLAASGETSVTLPAPARDHTERMLPAFGVPVRVASRADGGSTATVTGPVVPRATHVRVPGDPSAAAFFLAAAAATPGARVTARGVCLNPTRTGLLDVLAAMGARVEVRKGGSEGGEPVGDVTVSGPGHLVGFDVPAAWLPRLVDEVPAWMIAAAAATGVSRLSGAAELRVKESDRLAAIARNLEALGGTVRERADGLEIEGGPIGGGVVASAGDHRIAMAFAVLGMRARAPVTVDDVTSIATSFPEFVAILRQLGGRVEAVRTKDG